MIIDKISADLQIPVWYILEILGSNRNYKIYNIKKKNGGERRICHPSKQLKMLQYWIVNNVLPYFPVSTSSTAYEKKCSAVTNARMHSSNNFIFHSDICNFFESITSNHLLQIFDKHLPSEYELADKRILCDIVLWKGILPVGSVTSPRLANAVMYNFDERISARLHQAYNAMYTRYADDIVVSSKDYIPIEIINIFDMELERDGFSQNHKKIYFCSKSSKRQITGIVIDNNRGETTLGSQKLNELKGKIYKYNQYKIGDKDKLCGELSYLNSINHRQYQMMKRKYSLSDPSLTLFSNE